VKKGSEMPTSQPVGPKKTRPNQQVASSANSKLRDPSGQNSIRDDNRNNANELDYAIRFPSINERLNQDEEWCEVNFDGQWQRIRFHDYDQIFDIPGLYEALFYKALKCSSPKRVAKLLNEELEESNVAPNTLRVLDVGAGNGMMGERLIDLGVARVVGADILPEAKMAAERDRPDVYADYLVADLTELNNEERQRLEAHRFNCMTTVAALGFGDMPPRAFATAYNLVETGGWIAFNVKESFVKGSDDSGFSRLIRMMTEWELINAHVYRRYCHRLSMDKEPLYYVAYVARKVRDIPDEILLALD
jgi:2-polyprenyl-3-methyl-5-hydroxy-6-metoxy-1,4-benzoquinol methylase